MRIIQIIIAIIILGYNYKRERLISSTSFWVICYELIFLVAPVVTDVHIDHSRIIDIYSTIGIFIFFIGILLGEQLKPIRFFKMNSLLYKKIGDSSTEFNQNFITYCLVFIITLILLICSIGIEGFVGVVSGKISSTDVSLGDSVASSKLYSYIMFLLVPCLLLTWISAKKSVQKKIRVLCLISFILINAMFSFTRIWLICTVVIIFLIQIQGYSEKKKLILLLLIFFAGIFSMSFLNVMRGIGAGNVEISSVFDFKNLLHGTDFLGSYVWLDKLLNIKSPHINPIVYFKAFYAFIPRSIWPGKPYQMSLQILQLLDPKLIKEGYSTAGNSVLGEGYAFIGYIGMIIWPLLWGVLCEKIDRKQSELLKAGYDKCLATIFYYIFSVFVVISAQRGDWSQYLFEFLWLMCVPAYFLVKIRVTSPSNV